MEASEKKLSASPAGVVKPLEWDEPKKPDLYCSYDYTKANGAGLVYQVEWKSWKSYPGYCVYAGENMVGTFDTLEAAKSAAFADHSARIMSAIEPAGVGVETAPPSTHLDGNRPLPYDRDTLGRFVREAWVRWAETQLNPKPSWLVPYDELSEPDKEADRQIGEALARWTLIGDAARASFSPSPQPRASALAALKGDEQ